MSEEKPIKRRGRPAGSKNKQKTEPIITATPKKKAISKPPVNVSPSNLNKNSPLKQKNEYVVANMPQDIKNLKFYKEILFDDPKFQALIKITQEQVDDLFGKAVSSLTGAFIRLRGQTDGTSIESKPSEEN